MAEIIESQAISGVFVAKLRVFPDSRGSFREVFRKEWFPQRSWDKIQSNCSHSAAGVVRGLHYHFKQVDYWYCPRGRLRAALFDMRPDSPTYKQSQTIDMGEENDIGLFIPVGVAHGFSTLTEATLLYYVDNYYTGKDEQGIAWNDPEAAVDWGLDNPVVSERDQNNLNFADLPAELRY